jgi:deoxyribodipyrimidine photo-lyase
MLRNFTSREELVSYLRQEFPQLAARDHRVSQTRGGRKAPEKEPEKIDPLTYAQIRNFLSGAVTRLSPYIRYGILSLREVRQYILEHISNPADA